MEERTLTGELVERYGRMLREEERSVGTIAKYLRDVRALAAWLGGRPATHELVAGWRASLLERGYATVTVNSMLSAVNGLFRRLGWDDCRVRFLRVQRRAFRDERRELTREGYDRLLAGARRLGRRRAELLMETICGTGIRVSELRYVTVEAVRRGRAEVSLKGKVRMVLIPRRLAVKLLAYARGAGVRSGEVFRSASGRPLSRGLVWREMKRLCAAAGVEPSRVFPHNLRPLFAMTFYAACGDVVRLADVLGHSSVETTRVYLATSGRDHRMLLERLGLVT